MLPLKTFSFNKSSRTLTAEASDFGPNQFRATRRIVIKSEYTNKAEEFELVSVDRDREGDVQGWWYRPVVELANVERVLIIND